MTARPRSDAVLIGISGAAYQFAVCEPGDAVPSKAGIFVVADRAEPHRPIGKGRVRLLGRSDDLARTLEQVKRHARLADDPRGWVFCIPVEPDDAAARDEIARDLAARYRLRRGRDGMVHGGGRWRL